MLSLLKDPHSEVDMLALEQVALEPVPELSELLELELESPIDDS
jgi:hypothetical protein